MKVEIFSSISQFTVIPTIVITYDRWLNGNYEISLHWLNGGIVIMF